MCAVKNSKLLHLISKVGIYDGPQNDETPKLLFYEDIRKQSIFIHIFSGIVKFN